MLMDYIFRLKPEFFLHEIKFVFTNRRGIYVDRNVLLFIIRIFKNYLPLMIAKPFRSLYLFLLKQTMKHSVSSKCEKCKLLIWGGGEHTDWLLDLVGEEWMKKKFKIIGIYDKNPSLNGKKLKGISITNDSKVFKSADAVLISSRAFRKEMIQELEFLYPDKIVVDIYSSLTVRLIFRLIGHEKLPLQLLLYYINEKV